MPEKREDILNRLKLLTSQRGYIYSFCEILIDDFTFIPDNIHEINHFEKINLNEASLILGYLIKKNLDLTYPKDVDDHIKMKYDTYVILEDLHQSFLNIFETELQKKIIGDNPSNSDENKNSLWLKTDMMMEPLFYGDEGVYDFQYLEYLEDRYKYDTLWLKDNKGFEIGAIRLIIKEIREHIKTRNNRSGIVDFRYRVLDAIKAERKKNDLKGRKLLGFKEELEKSIYSTAFKKNEFNNFCSDLFGLFLINKTSLSNIGVDSFFENFSCFPQINLTFEKIGDYNIVNSNPVIKISDDIYFLPILYSLHQAIYENPFYWMIKDNSYKDRALKNRGVVGEEMFFKLLSKIFNEKNIFKSVKIKRNKAETYSDIDVLCVLGDRALCVQVKSKKLTLLSKQGNIEQIKKDFKEAIQEAYEQGLVCRGKILEDNLHLYGENGEQICLKEKIKECYIICGLTENYSALTLQVNEMLKKSNNDPFPFTVNIFDLELFTHYLNDPYEFLHYVSKRINLSDSYFANNEVELFGFHLINRLQRNKKHNKFFIGGGYASLIDRNYFPLKSNIDVSDKGDKIKKIWHNDDFQTLCNEVKKIESSKKIDILFYLYDLKIESKEKLIKLIKDTKRKTLQDKQVHDFTIQFKSNEFDNLGISYISLNNNNLLDLIEFLVSFCEIRKYSFKSDIWIGFGSLANSGNLIDFVTLQDNPWKYDNDIEDTKKLLDGRGQYIINKYKRNNPCYCGSGIKYKKCHGKGNN